MRAPATPFLTSTPGGPEGWHCPSLAILVILAAGPLAGGDGAAVEVGAPFWSGYPDGLARFGEPREVLELAPDGKGFIYVQGAPWRRLLYRSLERPDEPPGLVSTLSPHGNIPPRFHPSGAWVYFTAVEARSPLPPQPTARLRPGVVRVAFPGLAVEHLYPEKGSTTDTAAVLFDIHPSGEKVLLGIGAAFTAADAPDAILKLAEMPAAGGRPAFLGFQIAGSDAARYAPGGRAIDYTAAGGAVAGPEAPVSVHRFDCAEKTHRLLATRTELLAAPAGDLEVVASLAPHLGSFGWDGFRTYAAARPGEGERRLAPLSYPAEVLARSVVPPAPVAFRAGRVLLAGGLQDRPLVAAAPCTSAFGEEAVAVEAETPPPPPRPRRGDPLSEILFDPRSPGGEVLARTGEEARPLVEAMARTLRPPAGAAGAPGEAEKGVGEGPRALVATLVRKDAGAAASAEQRIEVMELAPGLLRVERFFPPPEPAGRDDDEPAGETAEGAAKEGSKPGAAAAGDDEPAGETVTEITAFDGKECWVQTTDGDIVALTPEDYAREVNVWSPFRLLLDPARLGDPRLRFGAVKGSPPEAAGGRERRRIAFTYDDGYHGELEVEVTGERVLPVRARTPLLFPSDRMRREMGNVPAEKEVTFDDWREWRGRLVPHVVRFDDGVNAWVIALLRLESRSDLPVELFRSPAR